MSMQHSYLYIISYTTQIHQLTHSTPLAVSCRSTCQMPHRIDDVQYKHFIINKYTYTHHICLTVYLLFYFIRARRHNFFFKYNSSNEMALPLLYLKVIVEMQCRERDLLLSNRPIKRRQSPLKNNKLAIQ